MKQALQYTLALSMHVAYMVIIPIFVFGGGGLWLDKHFNTSPLYLIIGLVIAFATTIYWMVRQLKVIIRSLNPKKG